MMREMEMAKEEILDLVQQYYDKYHTDAEKYEEGDRISYASRVYDA